MDLDEAKNVYMPGDKLIKCTKMVKVNNAHRLPNSYVLFSLHIQHALPFLHRFLFFILHFS